MKDCYRLWSPSWRSSDDLWGASCPSKWQLWGDYDHHHHPQHSRHHHHHHHHHHDHPDQNRPQDARTRFNLEIWCFRSSELQSKAICGGKPQKLGNKCQRWQRYLRSTDLQLVRSDVVRCDFVIWMYVIYLCVSVCDCVLFSVCVFACLCVCVCMNTCLLSTWRCYCVCAMCRPLWWTQWRNLRGSSSTLWHIIIIIIAIVKFNPLTVKQHETQSLSSWIITQFSSSMSSSTLCRHGWFLKQHETQLLCSSSS